MTQAKRWTFDEQESEKDVQRREQAVTGAQGYARSAVSMGGIFPRTCPFVAARTSHRLIGRKNTVWVEKSSGRVLTEILGCAHELSRRIPVAEIIYLQLNQVPVGIRIV